MPKRQKWLKIDISNDKPNSFIRGNISFSREKERVAKKSKLLYNSKLIMKKMLDSVDYWRS